MSDRVPNWPDDPVPEDEWAEQRTIEEILAVIALIGTARGRVQRASVVGCRWSWRIAAAIQETARQQGVRIALADEAANGRATVVVERASQPGEVLCRDDGFESAPSPFEGNVGQTWPGHAARRWRRLDLPRSRSS